MTKLYALAIVLAVLIVGGVLYLYLGPSVTTPTPQIETPIGEEQEGEATYYQSSANDIVVDLPFPGAVTGKEFSVRGKARGYWFFEASFPVYVMDKEGTQIAVGLAAPEPPGTDWMTENFIGFKADIAVPETFMGEATLVIMKDNPSGLPEHEGYVSFPITIEY